MKQQPRTQRPARLLTRALNQPSPHQSPAPTRPGLTRQDLLRDVSAAPPRLGGRQEPAEVLPPDVCGPVLRASAAEAGDGTDTRRGSRVADDEVGEGTEMRRPAAGVGARDDPRAAGSEGLCSSGGRDVGDEV